MKDFEALFGIDDLKEALTERAGFDSRPRATEAWCQRHRTGGLGMLDVTRSTLPLILLSGDVGCGKTALATCVATPVARAVDQHIIC